MTPPVVAPTYHELQEAAVRRFLQTALVVDDHAVTAESPAGVGQGDENDGDDDHTASHESPAEGGQGDESGGDSSATATGSVDGPAAAGQVDVKRLADRFADAGITCAILQPTGEEEAVDRIVRAAASADIVVIDWWINDTSGKRALQAIKRTVQQDVRGRRLIAVYTTQRTLGRIADSIRDSLSEIHDGDDDAEVDELAIEVGGTRIVVLNKGQVAMDPEYRRNQVPQDELPQRLMAEFRHHVEGLVPSAALNALAAARENTHRVLQRLSCRLDAGYAGHLLRIEHIDDGAGHLIDAVADELRAVIEDDDETRAAAGADGVRAWLDANEKRFSTSRQVIDDLFAINTAEQAELDEVRNRHKKLQQTSEEEYTALLLPTAEKVTARRSDADFAMLLSLRHGWRDPMLQLGTIIQEDRPGGRYWLCVQPVCDSVRFDGSRGFPMLRLEPWSHDERKRQFHIVIPGRVASDPPVHLWAATKPLDLHTIRMSATNGRCARFAKRAAGDLYLPTDDGMGLVWRGQLKPANAQRVAEDLGGQLTRVGLDESEWLRRRGDRRYKTPPDSRLG